MPNTPFRPARDFQLAQILGAALLSIAAASAQAPVGWALVGPPALAVGTEIQARTTDGKRYEGRFSSAGDDALVMTTASGEQRLPRATVARVSVKKASHRGRNALIGLGIGAGVGLGIGAGTDSSCKSFCFLGGNAGKAIFTPLGALVGVAIGVAIPTGGWREIYRAP
jgi:hypothetical protein